MLAQRRSMQRKTRKYHSLRPLRLCANIIAMNNRNGKKWIFALNAEGHGASALS